MKLFRHPGMLIAVFWCAAMVVAPMAAAAGAGQGTNQGFGPGQTGNNQMQPGQGSGPGNTMIQPGNGQDNSGPGQDDRQQGMNRQNMTGYMNMTPPDRPDRDNSTAFNTTGFRGHGPMNMTGVNMTDIPPPGDWDPATMTAMNQTGHGHGDGNMTRPAQPPQDSGADNGRQADGGSSQIQQGYQQSGQNNSDNDLIAELVTWLKTHGINTS